MNLTISIDTDGAAFQHQDDQDPGGDRYAIRRQVERITGAIAAKIEDGETSGNCRDINGNTCGTWELS